MDRVKRDLEATVASQKEQLLRYEKRLKDVVTAYKGLLKEKEALETSLTVVTAGKDSAATVSSDSNRITKDGGDHIENSTSASNDTSTAAAATSSTNNENVGHLQTQILTLMNSLATLSAEKSRMEASFQADKKQLRLQLQQKEQHISELQTKMKEREERAKSDVDEVKAKWIIERQEREQETNNQILMIRELQKLYADERHLKENIEMQLNNFKTQFANNEAENSRMRELQMQLKEARTELKKLQTNNGKNHGSADEDMSENATLLRQVRQEMHQLKEQHAVAIKNEQRRVLIAEEQSKKQAALHEDRVANLESRLAELSSTVGNYDRLRQQDQENIQVLKNKLQELQEQSASREGESNREPRRRSYSKQSSNDTAFILDDIVRLKKLLLNENARSAHPIDISKVFAIGTDHVHCQEEINRLQQKLDAAQKDFSQLQEQITIKNTHISTLQEKVKVLNRNIDDQELELKHHHDKVRLAIKAERDKWKAGLAEIENENRCKVNDLEQQLQKQRQRSLQLLDEKEQEIKTLHTSFEVFHNTTLPLTVVSESDATSNGNIATDTNIPSSDAESLDGGNTNGANINASARNKIQLKSKRLSAGENCHMLHYANEIARKDIEIAGLRKSKYAAETAMRKAIHEKVSAQEELSDKIAMLEEQVDRLERCKTREGANLEYLKNVIISFIVTKDADGKRHMMNAISAVLQFTPNETQTINAAFHKK